MFRYAGWRCVDSYVPVQYNIEYFTSTSLVFIPRSFNSSFRWFYSMLIPRVKLVVMVMLLSLGEVRAVEPRYQILDLSYTPLEQQDSTNISLRILRGKPSCLGFSGLADHVGLHSGLCIAREQL